jgi:hypothetical protein
MIRSNIVGTFAVMALALSMTSTANADDKGCSNASLKGAFAFTGTGVAVSPPNQAGPGAEVGTQTFDGNGNTTAAATLSANGNIVQLTITGTYTVKPDCTGTMSLVIKQFGVTIPLFFVIADSGKELQAIETVQGYVFTRIYRRQFPVGDWRE